MILQLYILVFGKAKERAFTKSSGAFWCNIKNELYSLLMITLTFDIRGCEAVPLNGRVVHSNLK